MKQTLNIMEQNKELTSNDANNVLAPVFLPPFRVGRKQMRAVLDAKGMEVVIFPKGLESYAKEYADFLNSKSLAPHRCPVCNGNGLVPNGFYMQTSGHWSTTSITNCLKKRLAMVSFNAISGRTMSISIHKDSILNAPLAYENQR